MTHPRSRALFLAFCLGLGLSTSGCLQPNIPLVSPAVAIQVAVPEQGSVTAVARLTPADAEGRRLLAAGVPWKKVDIHHMRISLYRGDSTALVTQTVNQAELDGTIVFSNLRTNTSYRLVAQAWSDADEQSRIDDGAADADSCTTTFTTTTEDRTDAGAIRLKLKGEPFVAQTSGSGIVVTDGDVRYVPLSITFADSTSGFADDTGIAAPFNQPNVLPAAHRIHPIGR